MMSLMSWECVVCYPSNERVIDLSIVYGASKRVSMFEYGEKYVETVTGGKKDVKREYAIY